MSHHITADKREIKDFPKLPSATSFIRKTLDEIAAEREGVIRTSEKEGCVFAYVEGFALKFQKLQKP